MLRIVNNKGSLLRTTRVEELAPPLPPSLEVTPVTDERLRQSNCQHSTNRRPQA